jgi:peroxiredoxin
MRSKTGRTTQAAVIFIVAAVAFAAIVIYFAGGGGTGGGTVGGSAPDFTLTDTGGETFSLSDFRGKVVVLDLMGTQCPPCQEGISHLKDIQQRYGDDVVILSISVAWYDTEEALATFKQEWECDWRFAIDTDDVITKYGVANIPKLVIIDKNGDIRFTHVGLTSSQTLIGEIDELL